jgi:hypothetical protein
MFSYLYIEDWKQAVFEQPLQPGRDPFCCNYA